MRPPQPFASIFLKIAQSIMKSSHRILPVFLGILMPLCFTHQARAQADDPDARHDRKPNIILINTDDLGYGALGCYGQTLIQTPRIDRMAAEGLRFTDFYSASAACVPSRVAMLAGRHPGTAAIRDNFPPHVDISQQNGGGYRPNFAGLWPPNEPTLGRVIKDAGYRTAQFGKLEAGIPMAPGMMTEHGWDHWFGFISTGAAFQFYPLSLWKNDREIRFDANRDPVVRRQGVLGDKGVYSQDRFMRDLLQFIRQNRDEPFFIYFPTQVPHGRSPNDGAQVQLPDIGPYADRDWTEAEKLYAAMLTRFDGHVGQILDLLNELEIDENTLVLLTSDNGDENSYYGRTHRFNASGALRAKKRFLYEGGIRVPMIARWPGRIQAGQTSDLPWAAWDFMATFADLASTPIPPHTDGITVVPTLLGNPEQQTPREYLYWEYQQGKQQAVRMGKWKGIRIGGTKEPIELYDLSTDIGETKNLAEAHPDIVQRIREIMHEARADSEFSDMWQIPEHRRPDIALDQQIFDQLEHGIR
jgi:arylsulfatase A-like enzyme